MNILKSPLKIQNIFDEIAPKYDFMNNLISFGAHKIIKKSAVNKLKIKNGSKALDLCTGTGDIAKLLAHKNEIESVDAVDFSSKMLEISSKKNAHKKIKYINANCTNLPFRENFFDIVTMFFGLRNIEDKESAIKEIHRVLKPEGQFLQLDFKKGNKFLDYFFDLYTPLLGKIFTKNPEAYYYLINSKQEFFKPNELEKYMQKQSFKMTASYDFLFSTISAQIFTRI